MIVDLANPDGVFGLSNMEMFFNTVEASAVNLEEEPEVQEVIELEAEATNVIYLGGSIND